VSGANATSLSRVPTGVPGLDTILGGGFLAGGVYIIQGTPGTGKTTLCNPAILSGPPARVSLGDLGFDVGRWF